MKILTYSSLIPWFLQDKRSVVISEENGTIFDVSHSVFGSLLVLSRASCFSFNSPIAEKIATISLSCVKSAYIERFRGNVTGLDVKVLFVWVLSRTGEAVSRAINSFTYPTPWMRPPIGCPYLYRNTSWTKIISRAQFSLTRYRSIWIDPCPTQSLRNPLVQRPYRKDSISVLRHFQMGTRL